MGNHIEIWIQLSTNAFHDHKGLGKYHVIWWKVDAMVGQDFNEFGEKPADLDVLQHQVVIIFDKVVQVSFEVLQVCRVGQLQLKKKKKKKKKVRR